MDKLASDVYSKKNDVFVRSKKNEFLEWSGWYHFFFSFIDIETLVRVCTCFFVISFAHLKQNEKNTKKWTTEWRFSLQVIWTCIWTE